MSGRGRGRRGPEGGGAVNRGEHLLPSVQQPGPPFPAMERKPLPLACGEEAEYLLALKQEFRGAMKTRAAFIRPHAGPRSHADVERYSDKYHNAGEQTDALSDWIPDWKSFPREIRLCVRRTAQKARPASGRAPSDQRQASGPDKKEVLLKLEVGATARAASRSRPVRTPAGADHTLRALVAETLAKEERRSSEGEEEEEEERKKEEDQEADEEYDEEELEEETDYIMSYFDNGEEFGAESDDNMDEAVY